MTKPRPLGTLAERSWESGARSWRALCVVVVPGHFAASLRLRRSRRNNLEHYGNPYTLKEWITVLDCDPISLVLGPGAEGGYYLIGESVEIFTTMACAAAACCTSRSRPPRVVAFLTPLPARSFGDLNSLSGDRALQQNSDPEIRTAGVVPPDDFVVELSADPAELAHAACDGHRP